MITTFNNDHKISRGLVYASATQTVILPDSAGASVASIATQQIGFDLSNQKIRLSIEVTEVSAGDGGVEVQFQTSLDGSAWLLAAVTSLAVDTTALATAYATVDLTGLYGAKWRLRAVSDGTDTQDACSLALTISGALGF